MPIYSETIPENQIICLLSRKYSQVFIIGCGACMNESLAFKYNLPITKSIEESKILPYATSCELKKIELVLANHGFNVESKYFNDINGFLCMAGQDSNDYPICWKQEPDIILTLCCSAGFNAIRERFPNYKVVKIAKQTAFISYSFSDKGGERVILKDKSTLIPISKKYTEV